MWDKPLKTKSVFVVLFLMISCNIFAQEKQYTQHVVAFYNVENLFDTINNPKKYDQEYTPESKKRWNSQKYKDKVNNIGQAIRLIGTNEASGQPPTLLGLCEVENRQVIEDVIQTDYLRNLGYEIIHFESPDSRGIDVALLYQSAHFYPLLITKHPLMLYKPNGKRLYTRDQLLVTGLLDKEEIHIIVNHWPSRYGGEKRSHPKRLKAAELNRKLIDSLLLINPKTKIITMGDFNDGPNDKSIKQILGASGDSNQNVDLFNPMYRMSEKEGLGTLAYNDSWELFDQIIISKALLSKDYTGFQYRQAKIVNPSFLRQQRGKYKGYPLRNSTTQAGYSDHFPVYITLIREVLD